MAYTDDLLNAAQRRRARTGNSYFPAANTYRGININAGPSANAINSTPQGQVIVPAFGSSGALPPDQNPAYQAAISRGRVNRNDLVTITTPSGGTVRVPRASAQGTAAAVSGSYITPTGPLSPGQYASAYNRGVGAPNPIFNPATGTLTAGGIERPTEQLTPGQRTLYGAPPQGFKETALRALGRGNVGDLGVVNNQQYASNLGTVLPNFSQIGQQFGTLARNVAGWFGGGASAPSIPPSANAGVPSPSPTPYQTPNPIGSPTPSPTIAPQFSPITYHFNNPNNPAPNESMSPPPIQGQMAPTNQGFGVPFRTSFSTAPADTGRVLMANEVNNPQFNPNQFYGANPAPTPRRYSDYGYY